MTDSQFPPPSTWEKLSRWSDKHSLGERWEISYPILFGVVGFIVTFRKDIGQHEFDSLIKQAAPIAVSIGAIFAGFQGSILAILLTISKSKVIRKIRDNGQLDLLLGHIRHGIGFLILFVVASMLTIAAYSLGGCMQHQHLIAAVLVGLFVMAIAASTRIMRIILKLIKIAAAE